MKRPTVKTIGHWDGKARPGLNNKGENDTTTIGGRMRKVREGLGYSRPKFSAFLGFPENSLKNYELGYRQPNVDALQRYGQLFNGDVSTKVSEYLIFGSAGNTLPAFSIADVGQVSVSERSTWDCLPSRTDVNVVLAEIIKTIRQDILKLSRPKMAEKIDIPHVTIKNYENTYRAVGVDYARALCLLSKDKMKAWDIFMKGEDCSNEQLEALWG